MKTTPIHNSVKQWADRATLGVKSIIGWNRTREKNNREMIERTENRDRKQFKNEQYKKQRKKNKSRDSTVFSTIKQQSLSGFISLHIDLYWTVRRLLYLFQKQELNAVCRAVINLLVNERESVLLPQVCDHSTIDAIYYSIYWLIRVWYSS